jgi:hypothetical protein
MILVAATSLASGDREADDRSLELDAVLIAGLDSGGDTP